MGRWRQVAQWLIPTTGDPERAGHAVPRDPERVRQAAAREPVGHGTATNQRDGGWTAPAGWDASDEQTASWPAFETPSAAPPPTATPAQPARPVARPVVDPGGAAEAAGPGAWPAVCHRYALRVLSLTEQLRPELDRLEADEQDEATLQRLYQVDHGITRLRRIAGDLRVLSGISDNELGDYRSSLMDVIREAESAIEHYPRVTIGRIAELGVVEYAAKDVASLLGALLENATAYSPSPVVVAAHLVSDGSVLVRIEDSGIGMDPRRVDALNSILAGPVPDLDEDAGRHTGFPVVHRLARRHGIAVRLACRPAGPGRSNGTLATVLLPAALLCEIPVGSSSGTAQHNGYDTFQPPYRSQLAKPGGGPTLSRPNGPRHRRVSPFPGSAGRDVATDRPWPGPPYEETTGGGLPRRDAHSLRRTAVRPSPRSRQPGLSATPPDERATSASRQEFAADLDAFTTGQEAARANAPVDDSTDDTERRVP